MPDAPEPVFSFEEPDHLKRIHLKLELENLGFVVLENGDDLALVDPAKTAVPWRRVARR
jgi:hypothetical protein